MPLNLQDLPEGCVLEVKAQPGARKTEFRGVQDGMLKVCVTAVAEKGKANKAILQFLKKTLGLRGSQLQILSGETNSQKRVLVGDYSCKDLAALLEKQGITDPS